VHEVPFHVHGSDVADPLAVHDQTWKISSMFVAATNPHIESTGQLDPSTAGKIFMPIQQRSQPIKAEIRIIAGATNYSMSNNFFVGLYNSLLPAYITWMYACYVVLAFLINY